MAKALQGCYTLNKTGGSMNGLLTPQQVAEMLHVQINTVYRYLETGQLKGFKLGKMRFARWRIKESDLNDFVERGVVAQQQEEK